MMIKTSLDWAEKRTQLVKTMCLLCYNPDLTKMLYALDNMIRDLSKAEVEARRLKRSVSSLPEYQRVTDAIAQFEKFLILARLMQ